MKLRNAFLIMILLALLDELFALWGAMDFTYQSFGWVPYLAFSGMYLIFFRWDWKTQLYLGAFIGLIYDFCFGGSFPVNFILYPLLLVEMSILKGFIQGDRVYRILTGCFSVFLLEVIPVLIAVSFKQLHISLVRWFVHQVVLTVLVNGVFMILIDGFVRDIENRNENKVS
ncbi:MAG: rod shape-determining protein MreD [Firmicutes bacterium]|nr:rod shape-determining protein MreD [Bacillota bacterium]